MSASVTKLLFFFAIFFVSEGQPYDENEPNSQYEIIDKSLLNDKIALIQNHPHNVKVHMRVLYMLFNKEVVNYTHFGSGVIISDRHILATAHIFDNEVKVFEQSPIYLQYKIQVCSGFDGRDSSIDDHTECAGGTLMLHDVDNVIIHPEFQNGDNMIYNDIAVITLANPMTFDANRQRINLPETEVPQYSEAVLTTYGQLDDKTDWPSLKKATFVVLPSRLCNISIFTGNMEFPQLCVLPSEGGVSASCIGNTGGPLVFNNTVVGLNSFYIIKENEIDCNSDYPEVYTSVFHQKDFINWAIGKEGENSKRNVFGEYFSKTNVYVRLYGPDAELKLSSKDEN